MPFSDLFWSLLDQVGEWGLNVHHNSIDDDAVPGSPFTLTCLPGSAHLASCRFVSGQHGTRLLGAVESDGDDLHGTPRGEKVPYLGHVAACGSKLKVVVRLVDKGGMTTRMSSPRQVQLALLPEKDPLSGASLGGDSEDRVHDHTLSAWVTQQLKAQRLAAAQDKSADRGAGERTALATSPVPISSTKNASGGAHSEPTGAFEGSSIVPLTLVSTERLGGGEGGEGEPLYEGMLELRKARRYRLALVGNHGQVLGPPFVLCFCTPLPRALPPPLGLPPLLPL